jgi:excisionase family DNA binding protein
VRSRSAQLLNLEETALVLGIGRSTIYRAVRDGKVPFPVHRIGGKWYVPKRALERFLDGGGDHQDADDDAQSHPSRSGC